MRLLSPWDGSLIFCMKQAWTPGGPLRAGVYSWWSYRFNARKNNAGWRIDYFIVSDRLRDKIRRAEILTDVEGSDHCPVLLEVDI